VKKHETFVMPCLRKMSPKKTFMGPSMIKYAKKIVLKKLISKTVFFNVNIKKIYKKPI
jgi:hypothetical protein